MNIFTTIDFAVHIIGSFWCFSAPTPNKRVRKKHLPPEHWRRQWQRTRCVCEFVYVCVHCISGYVWVRAVCTFLTKRVPCHRNVLIRGLLRTWHPPLENTSHTKASTAVERVTPVTLHPRQSKQARCNVPSVTRSMLYQVRKSSMSTTDTLPF